MTVQVLREPLLVGRRGEFRNSLPLRPLVLSCPQLHVTIVTHRFCPSLTPHGPCFPAASVVHFLAASSERSASRRLDSVPPARRAPAVSFLGSSPACGSPSGPAFIPGLLCVASQSTQPPAHQRGVSFWDPPFPSHVSPAPFQPRGSTACCSGPRPCPAPLSRPPAAWPPAGSAFE